MATRGTAGSGGGEDAFLSAVQRLHNPVLTFDARHRLRPMNHSAMQLMREESIPADLYDRDRSHPLSKVLDAMVTSTSPEGTPLDPEVTFPSGRVFELEVSERSGKGANRLFLLIFRDRSRQLRARDDEVCRKWDLTVREREVVQLLLDGASSEEVCAEMGISRNTLKSHLGHLFEKSGARTRAELLIKLRS